MEIRYTPSGTAVVKFGIAVNRSFTNSAGEKAQATGFVDVTAWRGLGENLVESLTVGARVIVFGHLSQDRWEDDGGQKRSRVYVTAKEIGLASVGDGLGHQDPHHQRGRRRDASRGLR